uniref:fimbrial protein n=1 Tax=Castellaniella defragrans TaxID=75697 RepID=UPI003340EB02
MKRGSSAARRRSPWWTGMGLALVLMCGTGAAHAACTLNIGGMGPSGVIYDRYNGALFQIKVPAGRSTFALPAYPQPPAGEILFVSETLLPTLGTKREQGAAAPLILCSVGAIEEFKGATELLPGFNDLYASGVKGIGYRVYYYYRDSGEGVVAPYTGVNTYSRGVLVFPFNGSDLGNDLKARIEFVATGEPIEPGELLPGRIYGVVSVSNTNGVSVSSPYKVELATAITVTPPTCEIQTPEALTVILPTVSVHLLMRGEGRGITAKDLSVACSSPSMASPIIRITPISPVGGSTNTLANEDTSSDGAKGVGVQMWLYDPAIGTFRNPVFNTDEPGAGAPQESLPSSLWLFRIGGSYLPIDAIVTAGKVSAGATLKFTYP